MEHVEISVAALPEPVRFDAPSDISAEILDALCGGKVLALRSEGGFVFTRSQDGMFRKGGVVLAPGKYQAVIESVSSREAAPVAKAYTPPFSNILRARACIGSFSDVPPFQSMRSRTAVQEHDVQSVINSGPNSMLKYMIAVSPDVVTVAIDNDFVVDEILDNTTAIGYRSGFTSSAAAAFASLLPLDTLIELCNVNDSLVDTSDAFEMVDHEDDASADDHVQVPEQKPKKKSKFLGLFSSSPRPISPISENSALSHSPPKKTNSADRLQRIPTFRRLVFTGYRLGGCVAQLAGIEALDRIKTQNIPISVDIITFSAPYCFSSSTTFKFAKEKHANCAVNLCSVNDACIPLINTALQACFARSYYGVASPELDQFIQNTKAIAKSTTSMSACISDVIAAKENVARIVDSFIGEHAEQELYPFAVHGFLEDENAQFDFTDDEDAIRARVDKIIWRSRNFTEGNLVLEASRQFIPQVRWLHVDVNDAQLVDILKPKIDRIEVIHSKERLDIVIRGLHLEPVLLRGFPTGFALADDGLDRTTLPATWASRLPHEEDCHDFGCIVLEKSGFSLAPTGGHMFIARSSLTELRITFIGLTYVTSSSIKVRTDFGTSDLVRLSSSSVAVSEVSGVNISSFASIDPSVFVTAYLRGVASLTCQQNATTQVLVPGLPVRNSSRVNISAATTTTTASTSLTITGPEAIPELVKILYELERIVINSGDLADLVAAITAKPAEGKVNPLLETSSGSRQIVTTIVTASRLFNKMLTVLAQPLQIECESKLSKVLRKVLSSLGVAVGAVFVVGAVIAAIPGALLIIPGAYLIHRNERGLGGMLAGPGAIALLPSLAIGGIGAFLFSRGRRAAVDAPTHRYLQILKLLLTMLDGNPASLFEEINVLEQAIVTNYQQISHSSLHTATSEDVMQTLRTFSVTHRRSDQTHPIVLFRNANESSKAAVIMWLLVVGRFARMRALLEAQLVVSFVGTHNSGKSTAIAKLFGFDTHASSLDRTESLALYDVPGSALNPTDSDALPLRLTIADFPGATDERPRIAQLTSELGSISSLFVCVFTAGHIAAPEQRVMELVQSKTSQFIVLINKCDILGSEFDRRFEEFRDNYSRVLRVPKDCLFFTNMHNPDRVEALRCILFTRLRAQISEKRELELALMLLHPAFRQQLNALQGRMNVSSSDLGSACSIFFKNNQLLSLERMEKYLIKSKASAQQQPNRAAQRSIRRSLIHSRGPPLNLEGRMQQPLLDMGFPKEIVVLVFEFISWAHQRKRDQNSTNPFESLERATSTDSQAGMQAAETVLTVLHQLEQEGDANFLVVMQLYTVVLDMVTKANELYDYCLSQGYAKASILLALQSAMRRNDLSTAAVTHLLTENREQSGGLSTQNSQMLLAAVAVKGDSLLRGCEQLSLLKHGIAVGLLAPSSQRVHPKMVYPNFKDNMSVEERTTLFLKKVAERKALQTGSDAMIIEVPETDAMSSILHQFASAEPEKLRGPIKAQVEGSGAIDVGGVFRGVMSGLAADISAGKLEEFDKLDNHEVFFGLRAHFRPMTEVRKIYRAVGRCLGLALWKRDENIAFPVPFAQAIFKLLVGQSLTLADLAQMRPQTAASLQQICLMSEEEVSDLDLTFTVGVSKTQSYCLIVDGENMEVTDFNRYQYLEQTIRFYLGSNLPMKELIHGVYDICSSELLCIFTPAMLQIVLCGVGAYTVDDLRTHSNCRSDSSAPQIGWFFECVAAMSDEDKLLLLTFVTASSVLPPGGLAALNPHFGLRVVSAPENSLPTAHTCFNLIDIPPYRTKEDMKTKLLLAIRNVGANEFGFA